MSKRNPSYQFYKDNAGSIIAVSTYAGHTVRGKAKCHPADSYDEELGKQIAANRCNVKIANKRYNNLFRQYIKAEQEKDAALVKFADYAHRLYEARMSRNEAIAQLDDLLDSINLED